MTSAIPPFAATYRAPQPTWRPRRRRLWPVLLCAAVGMLAVAYAIGAAVGPQTTPPQASAMQPPDCLRAMDQDAAGRRLAAGLANGDLATGNIDGRCVILPSDKAA